MADQTLGKITESIEELALKKQLPLRQQAQKPMLKYSNNAIKPVHLLNNANIVSGPAMVAHNQFSSLGQAFGSNTMSSPFGSSNIQMSTPQTLPRQATTGANGGQPQSSGSLDSNPNSSSSKGHINPYARPISAKDIEADLQHVHKLRKISSFSQIQSGVNPIFNSGSSAGSSMLGFPINSFMRPQSALRSVSLQRMKSDSKSSINSDNSDLQSLTDSNKDANNAKNSPRKLVPPTKLVREPDLSNTIKTDSKVENQIIKNQFGSTLSDVKQGTLCAANRPIKATVTAAAAAAVHVTSNVISKFGDSSYSSKNGNTDPDAGTKTNAYARAVSSQGEPGTAVPSEKSVTPDMQSKVRNLNYTPTRSYHEVADSVDIMGKPALNAAARSQQTLITMITVTNDQPQKHGTTYIAPSNISKFCNTNSLGMGHCSTKEYNVSSSIAQVSKESKSDTCIHEQRPPVVGASTKPGSEKGPVTNLHAGSEQEECDYESEIPSGERLPGDGEASLIEDEDDFEDLEEDVGEDLEDDNTGGSDGESDGYSITSISLSRVSSPNKSKSHPLTGVTGVELHSRPQTCTPDHVVKSGLSKSHFPNIPPVITFVADGEKVEQLPWEIRKYLKWRMSPITPNVVKHCLARSGFRISQRNHDWLGCWGKHLKSQGFKSVREYQKINHYPGSFQIGRKDRLWRNLSRMQVHFGKKEFGFFPQTYCLPQDAKLLKRAFEDSGPKQKWIVKPPASARGIGIKVISKITQVPKKKPVIVQKYLSHPYLINDSKFDCRVYVYVSSFDPLRLYVFEDGLARFASSKYSTSMKHLSNKFMHLTNYSVNKKNAEYQSNSDETVCQGHKWSLKALWDYMKRQGVNTSAVWDNMKDLIIKTIICADAPVNSLVKANCKSRYSVHELFGFDILLDEHLRAWILEVNISPSLHSNSQLDLHIKGQMIKDLFNIAGFRIPEKQDLVHHQSLNTGQPDLSLYVPSNQICLDKRLFCQQLSPDERAKHAYYSQRYQDEQVQQTILDILTPDDIRYLTESIDEDARKGGFQRVFPTPSSSRYLKYFETPRYYNLLLNQWVQHYNRMEHRGIALLQSFCEEGIHLQLNTENSNHQWNPPNVMSHSHKEGRLLSAPIVKQKEFESLKSSAFSSILLKTKKNVGGKKSQSRRSFSQTSSVSTMHNLVFSPQPMDLVSPESRVLSR